MFYMSAELPDDIKNNVVFANGLTHPELGLKVATALGIEPVRAEIKEFGDTELYARYEDNVRDATLIAFETHGAVDRRPVAQAFHRHLHMIDAAVGASAHKIIAVAPFVAGQRQDREAREREAVSANLNMRLLQTAGADHLVTVNIHEPRSLLEFRKPGYSYNNLTARRILTDKIESLILGDKSDYVLLSPDEGHSKELRKDAETLGVDILELVKQRDPKDPENVAHFGNLEGADGKIVIIIDDQISSAGTIKSAADHSKKCGAEAVIVAATHAIFSGPAIKRLGGKSIDHIVVTDTLPTARAEASLGSKLEVVTVSGLIANALHQILIPRGSVSTLEGGNARF